MSGARFEPVHWAGRFVRSLRRVEPQRADQQWAGEWMSPPECALFDSMDGRDQVHSIAVARRVAESTADRRVIAAALLHDVGKSVAKYGVVGRVMATVLGVVGGDRLTQRWSKLAGARGRMASYLDYPEIGRALLVEAGSDPMVSTWAAEHHWSPSRWTIPDEIARALAAADH